MQYETPMIFDVSKPGKQLLVDLLNESNRHNLITKLDVDSVLFSHPVALPNSEDVNTSIRLAYVEGFIIPQGSEEILYNRLDIKQVLRMIGFQNTLYITNENNIKSTLDLIPFFKEKVGICFTEDDIEDEPIVVDWNNLPKISKTFTEEDFLEKELKIHDYPKINIKIKNTSIAYIGDFTVELKPKPLNINKVIKKRVYNPWVPISTTKGVL